MIHYEYINPEQAQPGDLLFYNFPEMKHSLQLRICINGGDDKGKHWAFIENFWNSDYPTEIIDGKPTPALIARFTSPSPGKGKRFNVSGRTWIKCQGKIAIVDKIKTNEDTGLEYFNFTFGDFSIDFIFGPEGGKNSNEAETERERLIAWLEET